MVIKTQRLSIIPALLFVGLLVSGFTYSFDNITCSVHSDGRELPTTGTICEKKRPSCYLAGHRSYNCVRQHLAEEWGVTPEKIVYLGQTKYGETYQLVQDMSSLEKFLFPESSSGVKLIKILKSIASPSKRNNVGLPASLVDFVFDLNNILPILVETGQWIVRNPDWNPEVFEVSSEIQQGAFRYTLESSPFSHRELNTIRYPLPDDSWKPVSRSLPDLLTDKLDRQLATMGFEIPSPYFLNFIPPVVADRVVDHSLFLDSSAMIDVSHGMNTHQLQILSAYKAGVLNKTLLQDIIKSGNWMYLFDVDIFFEDNYYLYFTKQFEWDDKRVTCLVHDWDRYTLRSPYTIHMNLLSGDFSRSIEKALAKNQLKDQVRKTLGLTSGESLDEAINAIKTLEHYTLYRHYQILYEIYQSLLNTDLKSELSFRDFVQEQYVHGKLIKFTDNTWRQYAIKKSVQDSLLKENVTVFSAFRDVDETVQVTELKPGVSINSKHSFIVLKPGSEGIVNQALIDLLRNIAVKAE